jgi:glycerol-3-phosphate acyltransferase PlsX
VQQLRIGIDLMGSDRSPTLLFKAIEQAAEEFPHVNLVVFATQAALDDIFAHSSLPFPARQGHLEFQVVSDVIEMQDDPLIALRQKKNSSLVLGFKLLKKRYLDGFVSAGNTGALIAGATLSLPLLPGIKRPALLATLPTEKGWVAIIDVGGNVSCKAYQLVQFAQLGIAYQRCCEGVAQPRVGLLNIGVESKKGTSEVRQAYQLLQALAEKQEILFVGNVEGREVFQGSVDVLVTDGFTGNVLLKTSEGVSSFLLQQMRVALKDLLPEQQQSILHYLHYQFDYEEYNGALICGIDCVAVKCHGHSSPKGFLRGIQGAIHLVQNGFIPQIKQQLNVSMSASTLQGEA